MVADISDAAAASDSPVQVGGRRGLGGSQPLGVRLKKLFTKDDPINLHKTLGLLSIVHFCYRYFYVFPRQGNLGMDDANLMAFSGLALTMALSTSSLIFNVIKTRLSHKPMVIYEEYRLHAIVFTLRGMSVCIFGYFCKKFWPVDVASRGTDAHWLVLFCVVMVHHLLVDKITEWYGDASQTAVRAGGKYEVNFFARLLTRFYSMYQFFALASHLTVSDRIMDAGWNPAIAVQSSAFCMTLYRKRLIRGRTHAFWYTGCLILSTYHIFDICEDGSFIFTLKAVVLFGLRVHFGVSKYALWAIYSLSSLPTADTILSDIFTHLVNTGMAWLHLPLQSDLAMLYTTRISTVLVASTVMLGKKKPRESSIVDSPKVA